MLVPGIGAKVADKILELREAKGDLELDDLNQVPYLRITQPLLDCLDFTSFESKEGRGSLYDLHRERVRSVDKLIGKWDGTGQGQVKERGKEMGTFDKVPSTGGKSYYNKRERDWWQQANLPEKLDYDYSEMESTFMERKTPGGVKNTSAPGQYPPPSFRRTRRDDLDWDSSSDERDRSYMQNVHIRDSDIRAGYAFPREPGLYHSEGAEVRVPNIRTVAPANRESVWKDRGGGGRYSPPRNTGGGWNRENDNPLLRESRGRTRHTLAGENHVPRIVQRRDEYERERGHYRPSGEDMEGPGGTNPTIPRLPSSGNRPGCPPRRDPENPSGYVRREEYEGERGQRGRGKSVSLPMSLKFDGKSNWKAFYAKFSRYAEVSEWTEGECRDQLCWCLDGKASEYYALLIERNQEMVYMDLIQKLEKRFGFRELPETAQVQFNNARQTPDELLEDWADRVLSLATRAFRDLPETHMYKQAVVRLCQGATDKEAGSYASNIRPKNIEEAIDQMRWFQHNNQAIFGNTLGRNPRREVKQVSPGPHCEGGARVCAIGTDRVTDKNLGEVLSAQGKEMREIRSNIAALSTQMAAIMEEVKRNRIDRYRAQSLSPSPRKGDKQGCFHCGAMGHFKRECPKLGSPTGEKRVTFLGNKEALNSKGATRET